MGFYLRRGGEEISIKPKNGGISVVGGGPNTTMPPNKNNVKTQNTKKTNIKQNTKKIEKQKPNRRSLKRNKRAKIEPPKFVIYGNNCDRIGNKSHSTKY